MAALQHGTAFTDQHPLALLVSQVGAFFDAIFGALSGPSKGAENGGIAAKINGVITPVASRNHTAIKVQYLGQFNPFKADLI